jgi:hypothetical protein
MLREKGGGGKTFNWIAWRMKFGGVKCARKCDFDVVLLFSSSALNILLVRWGLRAKTWKFSQQKREKLASIYFANKFRERKVFVVVILRADGWRTEMNANSFMTTQNFVVFPQTGYGSKYPTKTAAITEHSSALAGYYNSSLQRSS